MPDITKSVMGNGEFDPEKQDRLADLENWDQKVGEELARQEGLTMTAAHWAVVTFLRDYYREHGRARSGRVLTEALEARFFAQGGRKYLYQLFPGGPVAQGSRIGAVPAPQYTEDHSFGSVQ